MKKSEIVLKYSDVYAIIQKTEKEEEREMSTNAVRIIGVHINNFKNVLNGNLQLETSRRKGGASVVGLYGQNGSGKTALIEAIELLKYTLSGLPIPDKFVEDIYAGADKSTLTFDFCVDALGKQNTVSYQFSIINSSEDATNNSGSTQQIISKIHVIDELIKCPILSDKQIKIGRLIDTIDEELFSPLPKRVLLTGNERETTMNLLVAKKLAYTSSRSYVFSKEMLTIIRNRVKCEKESGKLSEELDYYYTLIEALVDFGNRRLFVIETANSGLISLNAQPLAFHYEEEKMGAFGIMMIPLNEPGVVDQKAYELVKKIIVSMNIVLPQIIPGLTIRIKDLGSQVLDNGEIGNRIQLMSVRNGKEISFVNESEGIKKIVSILQLLIVVYNHSGITVAIDELDSGVFEYLLGELLRIISEKGKGQLIFTSHNLRPLETLERKCIAFTTTNPNNRYIRMVNVKSNNNLRDFYYRDIMLGEQEEELYEQTNNAEIAFAFREAGESNGT